MIKIKPSLLRTHHLQFLRPQVQDIGWGDDYGSTGAPIKFMCHGSLQPLNNKQIRDALPDGMRSSSGYTWRTNDVRLQAHQEGNTYPDYTIIEGRKYEVISQSLWGVSSQQVDGISTINTGYGLHTDHWHYILLRKALPEELEAGGV